MTALGWLPALVADAFASESPEGDAALLPSGTPWFRAASIGGDAGGFGVAYGEASAPVGAWPMLDSWLPAVVLPNVLPGAALDVDVAPSERVGLTIFRVTGSQLGKALGFGVGLGAAAWFTASGAVAPLVELLASDEGCEKLPELFTRAPSDDRMRVDGDDERPCVNLSMANVCPELHTLPSAAIRARRRVCRTISPRPN